MAKVSTDRRVIRARDLEQRAAKLRAAAEAERVEDFPKRGEKVRIKERDRFGRSKFGFANLPVGGREGIVKESWPDHGELIVEMADVTVSCGECGKEKHKEHTRVRYPEEADKVRVLRLGGS